MGFEEYRNLSEAELYAVLTGLANTQSNSFGFTESGQRIYDLAIGLKDKILTKEDIVGSEDKDGLLNDFAEEIKDDGVNPEIINKVLKDKFHVGQKFVIEHTDDGSIKKGKYVDDNEPQEFEAYIRKPKEEVEPEKVKEDFTEKILMGQIQDKLSDLDKKYPGLLGIDKKIDDAIELKKEIEQEIKEVSDKEGTNDGFSEEDIENYVNNLLEDLEKTDDFVDPDTLKNFSNIKNKLSINLKKILLQFNEKED